MNNILQHPTSDAQPEPPRQFSSDGGDGGGREIGRRLEVLERQMEQVNKELHTLSERTKHLATKEDMQKTINSILWKGAGILITALIALALAIIRTFWS